MNPIANQFTSIEQVTDQYFNKKGINQTVKPSDISFAVILASFKALLTGPKVRSTKSRVNSSNLARVNVVSK